LFARRFDDVDLPVIYVDGLIFSGHTVLAAVGVDAEGNKHVLGFEHAATASLREGLEECFTINRLGLPPSLHRCGATTNIVESPNAGVRRRPRRVTRWKDASMVRPAISLMVLSWPTSRPPR